MEGEVWRYARWVGGAGAVCKVGRGGAGAVYKEGTGQGGGGGISTVGEGSGAKQGPTQWSGPPQRRSAPSCFWMTATIAPGFSPERSPLTVSTWLPREARTLTFPLHASTTTTTGTNERACTGKQTHSSVIKFRNPIQTWGFPQIR